MARVVLGWSVFVYFSIIWEYTHVFHYGSKFLLDYLMWVHTSRATTICQLFFAYLMRAEAIHNYLSHPFSIQRSRIAREAITYVSCTHPYPWMSPLWRLSLTEFLPWRSLLRTEHAG